MAGRGLDRYLSLSGRLFDGTPGALISELDTGNVTTGAQDAYQRRGFTTAIPALTRTIRLRLSANNTAGGGDAPRFDDVEAAVLT